jgi:uncharacterized protein YciI
MAYFFCRLVPPRPTFMQTMSDEERKVMMAHSAYWKSLLDKGKAIVFGPVLDPAGGWGLGVFEGADEAEIRAFLADDPAALSGIAFRFDLLPMVQAIYKR